MSVHPWPLPEGWCWAQFSDVARVASDLVDPAEYLDAPHIAPNHIESETGRLLPYSTIRADGVTSPKHRFRRGQILYSKIRPYLAKVVVADFDGLCSADMYPIETELDARYLKWWMLTREFTRRAAGEQARTVLPKINVRALSTLPVPVAPPDQQQRIVHIVEDHLSRLDVAGRLVGEAQLRCLRLRETAAQSALEAARKLSSNVELAELVEPGRSIAYGVLVPGPHVSDGVPLIRVGDLQDGRITVDGMKRISPDVAAQFRRTFVGGGEVLLSLVGTIGRTAVVPTGLAGANVARAVGVLPLVASASPDFVSMILSAPEIHRHLNRQAHEVARKTLNLEDVRRVSIPMPSLQDQQRMLNAYRDTVEAVERMRSTAGVASAWNEALHRSVLAAAFTGGLTHCATSADCVEEPTSV